MCFTNKGTHGTPCLKFNKESLEYVTQFKYSSATFSSKVILITEGLDILCQKQSNKQYTLDLFDTLVKLSFFKCIRHLFSTIVLDKYNSECEIFECKACTIINKWLTNIFCKGCVFHGDISIDLYL